MENETHKYGVLLISRSEKFASSLKNLLSSGQYEPIDTATNGKSAEEKIKSGRFDIAIVNDSLTDISGENLAVEICRNSAVGVLLLVKSEEFPTVNRNVSQLGVLTLPKPTTETMVAQSLLLLCGTRERLRKMEERTASMEEKMVEIKIVNRAKCLLIEQLRMTEEEAHRYIEKQAMDRCTTKRTIAENILSTYK